MNKLKAARRKAMSEVCDVEAIARQVQESVNTLHETFAFADGSQAEYAMAGIESFIGVALAVLKRTPPNVIRDAAMTVEIRARLDGKPVLVEEVVA